MIANSARGKRISHTIASLPEDQVCSINPGKTLFERMPNTVLVETGTAPTDTARDIEISSRTNPQVLKSDRVFNLSVPSLFKQVFPKQTN